MSKTDKTNKAYRAYHGFQEHRNQYGFIDVVGDKGLSARVDNAFRDTGTRHGNNRSMYAKLKVQTRKIARRKIGKLSLKEINDEN